ncbi:MAG: hypothetical protein ACE5JO_11505, partial [Candidatus Binatia bacterium]
EARSLARTAASAAQPPRSTLQWEDLSTQLPSQERHPTHTVRNLLAVAATILIALGLGFWAARYFLGPPSATDTASMLQMGFDLIEYGRATTDPVRMVDFHSKYMVEACDPSMARKACAYPLITPETLPPGFRAGKMALFRTGCCTGLLMDIERESIHMTLIQQQPGMPFLAPGKKFETLRIGDRTYEMTRVDDLIIVRWEERGHNLSLVSRAEPDDLHEALAALQMEPAEELGGRRER